MSDDSRKLTTKQRRVTDNLEYLISRPTFGIVLGFVLLFLWLPMFIIIFFSFSDSGAINFPPSQYTLDWYIAIFNEEAADVVIRDPFYWDVVYNSFVIGIITSTAVVVIGLMSGYALNKYDFLGMKLFKSIAILPIIVPLIVTAIGMVVFFSMVNIELGMGTTILGHIIYTFPFGVIVITSAMAKIDPSVEEAARDLGSTNYRVFRKIILPSILPSVAATWLLVFTLSLNEFVITFFVSGPFVETLPLWIFDQLRSGIQPLTYSVSALTLYFGLILIFIVHRLIGIQDIRR